jgi:hypothetical protein
MNKATTTRNRFEATTMKPTNSTDQIARVELRKNIFSFLSSIAIVLGSLSMLVHLHDHEQGKFDDQHPSHVVESSTIPSETFGWLRLITDDGTVQYVYATPVSFDEAHGTDDRGVPMDDDCDPTIVPAQCEAPFACALDIVDAGIGGSKEIDTSL